MQKLTKRDVIEKGRDHLLAQGCFAPSGGGAGCSYRNAEGHKCAIGGLPGFPESEGGYSYIASSLLENCQPFKDLFADDVDGAFLNDVQATLHDDIMRRNGNVFYADQINRAADGLLARYCANE
jgi:hypothetical protein